MFVLVSIRSDYVPRDFGMVSAVLGLILFFFVALRNNGTSIVTQAVSYITGAFVIYLESKYIGNRSLLFNNIELAYFVSLALAIGVAIRYDDKLNFRANPMDFLVIVTVLLASYLLNNLPEKEYLGSMAVKLVIVFYGCELLFSRMRSKWHIMNIFSIATLAILAVRGVI
jgi:UDP-GlcNAc:undecaprenyl-phosphate GlcNAc-1-phosphate transferase